MTSSVSGRPNPTWGLVGVFAVLVAATAALFFSYGRDVEKSVQRSIVGEELERSRTQTREFARKVGEALRRSHFAEALAGHRAEMVEFRELADALLKQNRFIAYVHLQDASGETLMFKSPEGIQKVVVADDSVTFMERTTESVKFLKLEAAGKRVGIHDVSTLLKVGDDDAALAKLRIGISQDRLDEWSARAASTGSPVRSYVILASLALVVGFLFLRYHFERIHRLEERLTEQSRLAYVGTLASGLVHELRNPLNGVNLNLSLLEEEVAGLEGEAAAQLQKRLERIKPGLGHLEHVSNEFLQFARPPQVVLEPVDVDATVREALAVVAPGCERQGVRVVTELGGESGLRLLDRTRLRQILLNLMVNAVQAMPSGGTLTVTTVATDDGVVASVRDTGPGFSDEARAKLFTLFFTTKEGGVGLGLPIVRRLVEDLDGTIDMESEAGHGTTAVVRLPAVAVAVAAAGAGGAGAKGRDVASLETAVKSRDAVPGTGR